MARAQTITCSNCNHTTDRHRLDGNGDRPGIRRCPHCDAILECAGRPEPGVSLGWRAVSLPVPAAQREVAS